MKEGSGAIVKLIAHPSAAMKSPPQCDNPHDRPVVDLALSGADKDSKEARYPPALYSRLATSEQAPGVNRH